MGSVSPIWHMNAIGKMMVNGCGLYWIMEHPILQSHCLILGYWLALFMVSFWALFNWSDILKAWWDDHSHWEAIGFIFCLGITTRNQPNRRPCRSQPRPPGHLLPPFGVQAEVRSRSDQEREGLQETIQKLQAGWRAEACGWGTWRIIGLTIWLWLTVRHGKIHHF